MILLCCGDRDWRDGSFIREVLLQYLRLYPQDLPPNWLVIEGECRGADKLAAQAATTLRMQVGPYPARWGEYGLAAGAIRNRVMLDQSPDLVLAFHDNLPASVGTKDCVLEATARAIPVHHYRHGLPGLDGVDGVAFLPF